MYPGGGTFMIGMRLHGSVTRPAIKRVQKLVKIYGQYIPGHVYWQACAEERQAFKKLKQGLTSRRDLNGPYHLHHNEKCLQILIDAINFRDGIEYEVLAYSIMPNHVHLIIRHISSSKHMGHWLAQMRKFSGKLSNIELDQVGERYWELESYDHIIRSTLELLQQLHYTLQNPVVCGLAKRWDEWPGNYLNPACRSLLAARWGNEYSIKSPTPLKLAA